jgi:hypothetical protein
MTRRWVRATATILGTFVGGLLVLSLLQLLLSESPSDEYLARFNRQECALLLSLKVKQAEADARRALASGDRHLFAVYGYTTIVPGLEGAWPHGVSTIECTSDALGPLEARGHEYARRYNAVILAGTK